jgi:polyhydroxyalkanoate synthesis regulator phasin
VAGLKTSKWRVAGILLAVVILAGVVAGAAFADSTQADQFKDGALFDSFVAKLAANLGLEQDKVSTALEDTKKQMLDEAVQQGKLTQEQADKIAAGKGMCLRGFDFKQGKERMFNDRVFKNDGFASILGMTDEQLKAELQSGKKIDQIVTEHGLTMDQFKQKMVESKKEAIAKLVADGKITQDQADKMLQKLDRPFKTRFQENSSQ